VRAARPRPCVWVSTRTTPCRTSRLALVGNVSPRGSVIASVTEPFCGACDRIRLTADGKLRTCLFALEEFDLKSPLRAGATDEELGWRIADAVSRKGPGHLINSAEFVKPERTMSQIGG